MSELEGYWKLTFSEDEDKFLEAIGYTENIVKQLKPFRDPNQEVVTKYDTKDPKSVTNVMTVGGKEGFRQTTPLGKNITITDDTGTDSMIIEHTISDKQIILKQKTPNNKVAIYDTKVDGDELLEIMTIEGSDVKAKRKMTRVK